MKDSIKKGFQIFLFFVFCVSCQTGREAFYADEDEESFMEDGGDSFPEAADDAGDVIGAERQEEGGEDSDLENEFVDSEDFERDFLEEREDGQESFEEASVPSSPDAQEGDIPQQAGEEDSLESEEGDSSLADLAPDEEEILIDEEEEIAELEEAEEEAEEVSKDVASVGEVESEETEEPEGLSSEEEEGLSSAQAENTEDKETQPLKEEGEAQEDSVAALDQTEAGDEEESVLAEQPVVSINNIRYVAGEDKIHITGSDEVLYQVRKNEEKKQFIIEMSNAVLSENLKWPFIMKEFNTRMAFLKADQKDPKTVRVVIQMREEGSWPSVSSEPGGGLTVFTSGQEKQNDLLLADDEEGVFSDTASEQEGQRENMFVGDRGTTYEDFLMNKYKFTGKSISLHFKNMDLKEILYYISEQTGLNMVVDENVQGSLSLKLRNVPWDQALVTVLKTKGLAYSREGNVLRIMTKSTFQARQNELKQLLQTKKVLEPLEVKVIPVVYAEVGSIVTQIRPFLTKGRGNVTQDQKTNSLIVTDVASAIERLTPLIEKLDKSPQQVMIEAKIVEARETFVKNFGLNLEFIGRSLNDFPLFGKDSMGLSVSGDITAFPASRQGGSQGGATGGRTLNSNLNIGFAPVGQLDAVLGISENEGMARVISAPRIMVLNGETAQITQSTESIDIATVTAANAGTTTQANRNPVVFEFNVTPKITAVGSVFMQVTMRRQYSGPIVHDATQARPTNTREANTKVLVGNGQTIVIGGMYQSDVTKSDESLPLLKYIPIINWFFTKKISDESRNELLLFLTPRVLDATASSAGTLSTPLS